MIPIKEYMNDEGWVEVETQIGNYTIELGSYFFVTIKDKRKKSVAFNTIASKDAIDFFSKEHEDNDYIDFGDCFNTWKNDVWTVYSKPHSNNLPPDFSWDNWEKMPLKEKKKLSNILISINKKHFPKIVEFLKQEQFYYDNLDDVYKRHYHRMRKHKLERILND